MANQTKKQGPCPRVSTLPLDESGFYYLFITDFAIGRMITRQPKYGLFFCIKKEVKKQYLFIAVKLSVLK
ncbi:hypothetical protein SATMO3_17500 [Sporomusa aerivorans]